MGYRDHFWGHHLELLRRPTRKLLLGLNNRKITFFSNLGQKPGSAAILGQIPLFGPKFGQMSHLKDLWSRKVDWPLTITTRVDFRCVFKIYILPSVDRKCFLYCEYHIWSTFGPNWGIWPKMAADPSFWRKFEKNVIFVLFRPKSNFLGWRRKNLTIHLLIAHLY